MDTIFSLTKGSFAKAVRRQFDLQYPQYIDVLTNKHIVAGQNFIDGYLCCFTKMVEEPFNDDEISNLLISETVEFLAQQFNS